MMDIWAIVVVVGAILFLGALIVAAVFDIYTSASPEPRQKRIHYTYQEGFKPNTFWRSWSRPDDTPSVMRTYSGYVDPENAAHLERRAARGEIKILERRR